MFSYLWYGAYENIVSSVGLKRFNLLGSSSSSRAGMSSLECVISFSRYLLLKLIISALTVGICRSVCKIVFSTYHGALTIDLRTSFWNRCSIFVGISCLYPGGVCRTSRWALGWFCRLVIRLINPSCFLLVNVFLPCQPAVEMDA